MRSLSFGLSRQLWLIEAGIFLNMLGYGAVLPFEIIYLHDGRGFSLNVAGLVVGTVTGLAVVTAPLAGTLIDRFGARVAAVGAGAALAAGYTGLAFARTLRPRSRRVPSLAPGTVHSIPVSRPWWQRSRPLKHAIGPPRCHASRLTPASGSAARWADWAAAYGLSGFVALFLVNAVTYLVYVTVLVVAVPVARRPEPIGGGYRMVLRDRALVHLALTDIAMTAVGWGVFTWIVPPYARNTIGLSPQLIGLLLLANAATVVVAQVPVARFAEGRRRVVMMASAGALFAGACLVVVLAGKLTAAAYPLLVLSVVIVSAGESFFTSALMPLVADLAPAGLRGRYMASMGLCWWIGLAIAPTLGLQLLSRSASATFFVAAAVAAGAGVSALTLQRKLPESARLTPKPHRAAEVTAAN